MYYLPNRMVESPEWLFCFYVPSFFKISPALETPWPWPWLWTRKKHLASSIYFLFIIPTSLIVTPRFGSRYVTTIACLCTDFSFFEIQWRTRKVWKYHISVEKKTRTLTHLYLSNFLKKILTLKILSKNPV